MQQAADHAAGFGLALLSGRDLRHLGHLRRGPDRRRLVARERR